jgi:hypothetical protein
VDQKNWEFFGNYFSSINSSNFAFFLGKICSISKNQFSFGGGGVGVDFKGLQKP